MPATSIHAIARRPFGVFPVASLIALLFFAKFATYALLVTPLWDIPDESGHYSYVDDMAHGVWPRLGEAQMDEDVMRSWINTQARPGKNWIAQHPPLFYALDAPVVMAARAMGLDFERRVRVSRLPSALFGGLTVLGLALFLARATGRDELGLAGAIFFAATPMFTHLSTGVTHDTLVACVAAWAAYWLVVWSQSERFRHVLYAGALIAACTVTKITGLAMAVPLFFAISWRFWQTQSVTSSTRFDALLVWAARSAVLWLVMFVPVCLWIVRNIAYFGQMFPDATSLDAVDTVPIGFVEFMTAFPIWQHTLLNFIALVGWNGSGNGVLHWIQANGILARFFLAVLGASCLSVLLTPFVARLVPTAKQVVGAAMLLLAICVCAWWPLLHITQWTYVLLFMALLATLASQAKAFWRADGIGWVLAAGAGCVLFFLLAYYETLRTSFTGGMRATHGRYLYPVVPFLILTLFWPFRDKVSRLALLCAALIAMLLSDAFFLHQVFGMYGQLPG